ncbi:MAG: hypothetical protein ABL893_16895, partial [Hyphomicrobium sp.]
MNDTRFEFTEASADFGGRAFSGDVVVSGEGRRKVAVTLEGARLDSSELFPDTARALESNLRQAFGLAPVAALAAPSPASDGEKSSKPVDASRDISVRVLAGELKHGERIFRNVDATVGLDGGSIRIPSAKFTMASGLVVHLDARITSAADHPKGTLAYDFVALTPGALKDLASFTGLGNAVSVERFAQAGSARLAGLVRLGARGKSTAEVSLDGTVQTARISGQADFDGGLAGWRTDPSRIQLTARAQGFNALLAALGIDAAAAPQPSAHEAELIYASTGALSSGAATLIDLSAPGFAAAYNGQMTWPADSPVAIAGRVRLKANDALDALAIAGIPAARGIGDTALDGVIDVAREAGAWTIASRNFQAGGSALRGSVKLVPGSPNAMPELPDAKKARFMGDFGLTDYDANVLTADLQADTVTLAGLLAPLLDTSAPTQTAAKNSVWPEARISFDPLANATGVVSLRYGKLQIDPGISASNGALKIAFAAGKAALSEIT